MHKKLTTFVQAVEQSEGKRSDDGQWQKEPKWIGFIPSVNKQHHKELDRVLRLGSIRYYSGEESSKRVDKGKKKVVTGNLNLSPRV